MISHLTKLFNSKYINVLRKTINHNKETVYYYFASRKDGKKEYMPYNKLKPDIVAVIPFHEKGLAVVSQFRPVIEGYEWDLPCGLMDDGESFLVTASRELKEETGLVIDNITDISPTMYISSGFSDETIVYVTANVSGSIKPTPDPLEEKCNLQANFIMYSQIEHTIRMAHNNEVLLSDRLYRVLKNYERKAPSYMGDN